MKSFRHVKIVPKRKPVPLPAHSAYMKISCLEMERVRLTKEKNKAAKLIAKINARLEQIDAEKDSLLTNLVVSEMSIPVMPVPVQTESGATAADNTIKEPENPAEVMKFRY
jgi:hypothetical protein